MVVLGFFPFNLTDSCRLYLPKCQPVSLKGSIQLLLTNRRGIYLQGRLLLCMLCLKSYERGSNSGPHSAGSSKLIMEDRIGVFLRNSKKVVDEINELIECTSFSMVFVLKDGYYRRKSFNIIFKYFA